MRGLLLAAAGFMLSLVVGWREAPQWFYRTATQPLQFNHAVHTGGANQMTCDSCHALQESGRFGGVPAIADCAACHAAPIGNSKDELLLVNNYVTPNREPQWVIAPRQPDNAWFPHAAHVKRGKLECKTCHEEAGKSTTIRPVRVNRMSGYSREVMTRMRMNDCVACHRTHQLEHSCLDCHR